MIATVKHYAVQQPGDEPQTISSDIDARTLHEIYLPAFEAAVKQGHVGSVMCSYNQVTLDLRLRAADAADELPEARARLRRLRHVRLGRDALDRARGQRRAGHGDVPEPPYFGSRAEGGGAGGQVPQARLDDMVHRILRTMFSVGLFDYPPAAQPDAYAAEVERPRTSPSRARSPRTARSC